jgi:hypothetical protein
MEFPIGIALWLWLATNGIHCELIHDESRQGRCCISVPASQSFKGGRDVLFNVVKDITRRMFNSLIVEDCETNFLIY